MSVGDLEIRVGCDILSQAAMGRKGNNRVVSQLYHWQTFQLTIFAISVDKMLQEVSPKPSKEPATSININ